MAPTSTAATAATAVTATTTAVAATAMATATATVATVVATVTAAAATKTAAATVGGNSVVEDEDVDDYRTGAATMLWGGEGTTVAAAATALGERGRQGRDGVKSVWVKERSSGGGVWAARQEAGEAVTVLGLHGTGHQRSHQLGAVLAVDELLPTWAESLYRAVKLLPVAPPYISCRGDAGNGPV